MKLNNFDIIIIGFCDVFQGLARIISLGFWQPGWHTDYVGWKVRQYIRKIKLGEQSKGK